MNLNCPIEGTTVSTVLYFMMSFSNLVMEMSLFCVSFSVQKLSTFAQERDLVPLILLNV